MLSNVWNKTFENELITINHRIQNKWTEYKIFELKLEIENCWMFGNITSYG